MRRPRPRTAVRLTPHQPQDRSPPYSPSLCVIPRRLRPPSYAKQENSGPKASEIADVTCCPANDHPVGPRNEGNPIRKLTDPGPRLEPAIARPRTREADSNPLGDQPWGSRVAIEQLGTTCTIMVDVADRPRLYIATAHQPKPSFEQPRLANYVWARRLLFHPAIVFFFYLPLFPHSAYQHRL